MPKKAPKDDPPAKGKKGGGGAAGGKPKRAKEAPQEEEEVDYTTSGPDIEQHKKYSNYIFGATLFTLLTVIAVLVFMGLRKKLGSGKHATTLGTAKGLR
jgi:hypothetical protein